MRKVFHSLVIYVKDIRAVALATAFTLNTRQPLDCVCMIDLSKSSILPRLVADPKMLYSTFFTNLAGPAKGERRRRCATRPMSPLCACLRADMLLNEKKKRSKENEIEDLEFGRAFQCQ